MNTEDKNKLANLLYSTIDAEHLISRCYSHLMFLVKNGRIRNQFQKYVKIAEGNKTLLGNYLKKIGVTYYCEREECKFCKVEPDSFSLIGAINLGLEITSIVIKLHKELLSLIKDKEDKKIFSKLLERKIEQRRFLRKEKKVAQDKEDKAQFLSLFDSYCIPKVVSKLKK